MLERLRKAQTEYPRQFWLMFWGMLISTIGSSMIWPFLMIYVSEKLQLPLTAAAGLTTLSSMMGLISSFIVGPIIDKVGRKWTMVISLALNAVGYLLLSQASSLPAFALIMALNGAVNPLYRVGADAMMADLVAPEKRNDAYSLLRMSNNIGIAIGPSIGGFMAAISYSTSFFLAAAGLTIYSLLIAFFAIETLPQKQAGAASAQTKEKFGGYGQIFKDRPFITFAASMIFVQICASLIWVLLAVYAKQNFHISESLYGFIPTTNALMVVFLQLAMTQLTKRFRPLPVVAVGALFYACANLSIAFGQSFWAFWASMVIMTLGELALVPTSSTYVANRAPIDKRGRYMSIYTLTWGIASGIGPVLGGFLNDTISPRAIWFGGAIAGFISVVLFITLSLWHSAASKEAQPTPMKE